MKTTHLILFIFLCFQVPVTQAQEEKPLEKIEQLEKQKEQVAVEERETLRLKVEGINRQLEDGKISTTQAIRLKEEAAKQHDLNIEKRLAKIDNEIAWLSRSDVIGENEEAKRIGEYTQEDHYRVKRSYHRTSTLLVLAAGFNNVIEEGGSINDSDFKLAGSRFFEIGLAWRTRVFENSNWLRVKYGFSFQFNGLKPTDNRYFVEDGDLTVLETYPIELNKSKFRMDNLVFPLHFEFGPSYKSKTDWGYWFSTEKKFRIGLGGFVGFNMGERQKLKYKDDGDRVKQKMKNDFNTNDLIYGLSGYVGWGATSLYAKYDLNPIFQDPNVALNNVSLGLRFDLN